MNLTGKQLLGCRESAESSDTFAAKSLAAGADLAPAFHEATSSEIDAAVTLAGAAFDRFRSLLPETRADFLDAIAEETLALTQASLATQRRLLDTTTRLAAAGDIAAAEVTRSRARTTAVATDVESARLAVLSAQGALADAGHTDLYDLADRFLRGGILATQFSLDDLRVLITATSDGTDATRDVAERIQGGFGFPNPATKLRSASRNMTLTFAVLTRVPKNSVAMSSMRWASSRMRAS